VGSLYKSTGLLGRLFDRLWDVLLKVEKESIATNYTDFDLLRPGRESFRLDALNNRALFNRKTAQVICDTDLEDKLTAMDALRKEFRDRFFNDPLVKNNEDARLDKASAWYCASYSADSTDARSFCWIIYDVV